MNTDLGRPVVVGVDGSDSALRAVRWAAAEAARRRAPLRLVSAFGWDDDYDISYPGLSNRYRGVLEKQARDALAAAVAAVAELDPALDVTPALLVGYPIPTLVAESRRAALLVVGDRGANRVEGLLMGSVGVGMAAHAECPVVVVRGRAPDAASGSVVVGVDGTPVSEAAVAFAFRAAADRGVPLVAVHTWRDDFLDPVLAGELFGDEQAYEEQQLAERLAGWAEKYPQVEVIRMVSRDRPVHLLLEQARRAQLVVVGSRGHGELAGLVLGSVSNALVHKADCPVAIVRPVAVEQD